MADAHPWDDVASELLGWLQEEPAYYVEALKAGHRSPFSAEVSEQEKLRYYRDQVFNVKPDGTPDYTSPNEQGRKQLLNAVGIPGYTAIMKAVMPAAGLRTLPENEDDNESLTGEGAGY